MIRFGTIAAAWCAVLLLAACESSGPAEKEDFDTGGSAGVFCLCEGNMNAGNASLSYYDPAARTVQNEVFYRANGAKLGDVAQSIFLREGRVFIPISNSGVIWAIDADTFRVEGKLEAASSQHPDENNHIVAPRYIHFLSDTKAYVTDLFSPYITIFDPRTCKITGAIHTGQTPSTGSYNSTEQMAQYDKWVFVNCWSYSNKILVIDSDQDKVVHEIELRSIQPNSLVVDRNGKLWALTATPAANTGRPNPVSTASTLRPGASNRSSSSKRRSIPRSSASTVRATCSTSSTTASARCRSRPRTLPSGR